MNHYPDTGFPEIGEARTLRQVLATDTLPCQGPLKLLQITNDPSAAGKIEETLKSELPIGTTVDHADSVSDAFRFLSDFQYDAVLLDVMQPEGRWVEKLHEAIKQRGFATPVISLASSESPSSPGATAAGCDFRSRLQDDALAPTVLAALKGHLGHLEQPSPQVQEKRLQPRYWISSAAVLYQVGHDLSPGEEINGIVVDISRSGIGLTCSRRFAVRGELAVVGVDCPDGIFRYATVRWQHTCDEGAGQRCGGQFVHGAESVFEISKLAPIFHSASLTLAPRLRESIAHEWACRGVLRPVVVDQVMTCPRCQSLPTFRMGCPRCGSSRTDAVQLIHHFACAHVAPTFDFECSGQLICPKCRTRDLVVGSDFEHLNGPHQCLECDWSDLDTVLIAECLKCGQRFPGKEAHETYVVQYHVDRLDPLALIQAT